MAVDFARLRLKHHGDSAKLWEILQMECREKCSRKLPGLCSAEGFEFPSLAVAEMSTSEEIATVHAGMVPEGARVLDMTFGLGVDTFALARRGCEVTAVELDHGCYEAGRRNIAALGLSGVDIHEGDSVEWLRGCDGRFDVIFVDPARRDASGRHFALSQCSPDLTGCIGLLRDRCRRLIVKASPMLDVKLALRELGVEREAAVSVIGTPKECKEVVLDIPGTHVTESEERRVRCITCGHGEFSFPMDTSVQPARASTAMPEAGGWLLEPYPAVMKAAPLGAMAHIGGVAKLHPNTHLFFSREIPDGFPGEAFSVKEVMPFSKGVVRTFARSYPTVNVAVRNFPMSAPALASRLKVREGGDLMVHGVTLADGSKALIVTGMGTRL